MLGMLGLGPLQTGCYVDLTCVTSALQAHLLWLEQVHALPVLLVLHPLLDHQYAANVMLVNENSAFLQGVLPFPRVKSVQIQDITEVVVGVHQQVTVHFAAIPHTLQ
jgi:hypothetical protein